MKRISTRFALLMASVALLPLLAYGAWSIVSLREVARQTVTQGNQEVASQVAEQIQLYVVSTIRMLKAVSTDLHQTDLQLWQKDRILKSSRLRAPELIELTILDGTGRTVATSRLEGATVSLPGSGSREIQGVLMSNFSLDDAGLPTAVLAIPDASDSWLVARVNLEELWRVVDKIRVGEQGFALVITEQNQLLAHGDPESKSLVARGGSMQEHPLIAGLGGVPPEVPVALEYDDWVPEGHIGQSRGGIFGVAAQVPALAWTVIVEQPTRDAFAGPNAQQQQLQIAIAVALVAMLSIGYTWGRSFIVPIQRLTRATRALADGHLDERVIVESKDELGQLATAFNNMADRLVELQEDVKRKERQAMFGRVSIGLVHDLSNPIQNIGNACKMMGMMFEDLEYRETFKRTTERELAQIKRMLDDLRNIAKPVPLQKFPLDLNKAIAELVESMQPGARSSGLTLEAALCFGPLYIEGDVYALNRVYGNLIRNAFQATAPQGTVTVRTVRESEHALVQIADTGAGIPPDRLATIFDDFVTTKKRGLGLGLAIAKRIVEQLDGTIAVASEVGRGTTFTMRFPLTRARPEQLAS
jgi:signal transduction histidine kinase